MTQQIDIQARQLAKLVGTHGSEIACLILDVRDVEEHTLCHIRGGGLLVDPTLHITYPAPVTSML